MSKQFQALCFKKLVLKNVLLELHEAKGYPLEKKSKTDLCALLSINNFYGGYFESL